MLTVRLINRSSSIRFYRGVPLRLPAIAIRIFAISLLFTSGLHAQNVSVRAADSYTGPGEQGFIRILCSTNIPLGGLRIPIKLESTSITIDSVVFSSLVPASLFNVHSQLSNSNRRGFVQVLPQISGSPPTFYAYDDEIFRIYYEVVPTANEFSIVVDTFYNRYYDAGHWLIDEIEASDGVGNRILPEFQSGRIWIQQFTDVETGENAIPVDFALDQNYPNPFNPSTTIVFSIPADGHVALEIFDILGRQVETLVDKRLSAGQHRLVWSAENEPSGLYFYRLTHSSGSILRKMAIVK